jgi:hypothetical protein
MKTDNTQETKRTWNRLYIAAVDNEDKGLADAYLISDTHICGV